MRAWGGSGVILVATSSALVVGCATTKLLHGSGASRPASTVQAPTAAGYVIALASAQARLAAAEHGIPRRARTARAFAHAIALLARAIGRLAHDLAAIGAPRPVVAAHVRLVAIVRSYSERLARAAQLATRPGGELAAATLLVSSTNTAEHAFSATVAAIDRTLGR